MTEELQDTTPSPAEQPAESTAATVQTQPESATGTDEQPAPTLLESEDLQKIIETLLFITDRPVKVSRLVDVIENTNAKEVREAITKLQDMYS